MTCQMKLKLNLPALCLISLTWLSIHAFVQDETIYGIISQAITPIDNIEQVLVTSLCFSGMGLLTCTPAPILDDVIKAETLSYYRDLKNMLGSTYCLECCSDYASNVDIWNLTCPMDLYHALGSNLYGMEFRFARRRDPTDMHVVTCPLPRSACTYTQTGQLIACDANAEADTFLHGYTVTLTVNQYEKNLDYWKGVESCSAVPLEFTYPLADGSNFYEDIVLIHKPLPDSFDYAKLGFLSLFSYFLLYCLLYFCRKNHCLVCQKKLVFSSKLCYICQFVGASPPDPILMLALEEKTLQIQGTFPEYLPGSTALINGIRRSYRNMMKKISGPQTYPENTEDETKESKGDFAVELPNPSQSKKQTLFKNKSKGQLRDENPNKLNYSENIIYSAVGHNNPPPPSDTGFDALRSLSVDDIANAPTI